MKKNNSKAAPVAEVKPLPSAQEVAARITSTPPAPRTGFHVVHMEVLHGKAGPRIRAASYDARDIAARVTSNDILEVVAEAVDVDEARDRALAKLDALDKLVLGL